MGRDLTNLYISSSFQGLVQISGSQFTDGTGSLINYVDITASYASAADTSISSSYAITASYALNAEGTDTGSLMITGSVATNVLTFTKGDGSTFDVDISNPYTPTQPLAYGSFYSSVSQSISGGDNTPQVVALDGTYVNLDVNLSGSGAVKFTYAGIYQLNYVIQVASLSNAQEDVAFWIKYNGANFANSTTVVSLQPRKNVGIPSTQLMTLSLIGQAQNDDDYIELWWQTTNAAEVYLDYQLATANYPETPSAIVNINPVR